MIKFIQIKKGFKRMISHFIEKFHLKEKILNYQKISHKDSLSSDVFKIDLKKDKKVILKVFFNEEKGKFIS